MKKAIYFLRIGFVLVLIAYALKAQEVEGLKQQTSEYIHTEQKLKKQHSLDDARIFELESEVEYLRNYQQQLKGMIEGQAKTIMELSEELEIKREQQRITEMTVIFDSSNITIPSNVTVEKLEEALSGGSKNIAHLAPKFVEIEQEHGINAIYLAAKTAWESDWGRSGLATYKNNVGGVKNPGGNGYRTFSSQEACLDYIAKFLKMSYLDESGKYYNGKSVAGVAQKYNFGDEEWIKGVTSIAHGLESKTNNK